MRRLVLAAVALVMVSSFSSGSGPASLAAAQLRLPVENPQIRVGVARPGGGYTVTTVPLETYVARVLGGEAAPNTPPSALEALAIAVRTYTLANLGRHRADDFDLCDETHCQVMRAASPATERAAAATAGRALMTSGGVPASIYYSASCGGRTEIPSQVWPGADDPPYLPSQPDDGCGGAPAWSAELTSTDLLRALRAGGFRGARLRDVRVASRNGSGRVARLRLEGLEPAVISGQDLRAVVGKTLGWQFIKSTAFELERRGERYRFEGHGSGHGVGMCVIGSMRLATVGQSAEEILQRYYPGLAIQSVFPPPVGELVRAREPVLPAMPGPAPVAPALLAPAPAAPETSIPPVSLPPPVRLPAPAPETVPAPSAAAVVPPPTVALVPDVRLSLPAADEAARGLITDMAVRVRTELARTLGVPTPRVMLRFHPTAESYERATGEPWFTSAAIVDGEIHLLPPGVLRERGVLERTLRHEIVHVMTNAALAGRPLWVREGAAVYFSDEPAPPRQTDTRSAESSRVSCPDDAELDRPVSVGALTNAYARAQACFARDLARHKSWRDIK